MQLVHDFVVPQPIDSAWNVLTDLERIAPCMPGAQLTEVQGDTYRGTVKVKVGPILAQFAGEARFKSQDPDARRAVIEARGKEAGGKGLASALITAQLNPDGDRTAVNVVVDLTLSGRIAQFGRGTISEISTKLLGQFVHCLEETVLAEEAGGSSTGGDSAPAATEPAAPGSGAARSDPTAADTARQPAPQTVPPPVAEPGPAPAADYLVAGSGLAEPAPAEAAPAEATSDQPAPAEAAPAEATSDQPVSAAPQVRKIDAPQAKPVDLLASAGPSILKRLIPALVVLVIVVALIVILVS